jgi:hypothetical protein
VGSSLLRFAGRKKWLWLYSVVARIFFSPDLAVSALLLGVADNVLRANVWRSFVQVDADTRSEFNTFSYVRVVLYRLCVIGNIQRLPSKKASGCFDDSLCKLGRIRYRYLDCA